MTPPRTRSGFVALAGRPNVGKSTLVNAMVGAKVAIVSDRPQTTRRAVRGVVTGPADRPDAPLWQLVLVDLPGVQRPRDALTERMQHRVERELADADAALFVLDGEKEVGAGDRFIGHVLARSPVPVTIAVNKVDRLDRARTAAALQGAADLGVADEIFPVSARTGAGVATLLEHLVSPMPEGPLLFPPGDLSDLPKHVRLAELIREAVLARTFQEVPHAVEVIVEEVEPGRDGLTRITAAVWVETESQKGIVIGAGGRKVKSIGTAARRELQRELGVKVHLDLSVRVRRRWRADDALLDRLEIE